MPSCLGIYIENGLIKYAKISKERDNTKVESFGIKFDENVEKAVKQIISETYSFKTPISVNLGEENYTYSEVFSLLNKNDTEKSANTEFELFCNENNKNKNALQYRKLFVKLPDNTDKLKTLYAYTEKANTVSKIQLLDGKIISGIYPEAIEICKLKKNFQDNSLIINIEGNTTVTTIVNGEVFHVDIITQGMKDILGPISLKENSYSKAYEICKNATIYTMTELEEQTDVNEYMDTIMPVLYSIIQNVKEIISKNGIDISSIYLTGSATVINNIDLYFQQNFHNKQCEIIKPYFLENLNLKVNVKDYIEVNSAIALALATLEKDKDMNFKQENALSKFFKLAKIEKKPKKSNTSDKKIKSEKTHLNIDAALAKVSSALTVSLVSVIMLIVIYISFDKIIVNKINSKQNEINDTISDTNAKIEAVGKNTKLANARSSEYEKMIEKIESANEKTTEQYKSKNAIPNLLNQIMFNVPKDLQILSIKNTSGKHIQISLRAKKYDDLGYFKAAIRTESILTNISATSGTKTDGWVYVTIEGDLPY